MRVNSSAFISLLLIICVLFHDIYCVYLIRKPDVRPTPVHQCGYKGCPRVTRDILNVHLVPHSHNDVGWLKTFEEYYQGLRMSDHYASVERILNAVVDELIHHPERRFTYVESAFFFKWWREQDHNMQAMVKLLVNEGRLEFVGGAWSMNDEATTYYQSIIDQFSWGLRLLNDTFGECARPRVAWQIDPFGHSREMASMLAQMAYDGLFLGRIDYEDREKRLKGKNAEFIWHGSPNVGNEANLFTSILYNKYHPPHGFCFDMFCKDTLERGDVKDKIKQFVNDVYEWSHAYRTYNILIPMGGDFHYQDAKKEFRNIDLLITNVNSSLMRVFYSTPSCYLNAVHYNTNPYWPWSTKDDDFFPYASGKQTFWTGFYTSRPNLKRYERVGNHFLQVCKALTALAPSQINQFIPNLSQLREAMGVLQHHHAITGTAKKRVAEDYAAILSRGISACSDNTRSVLNMLAEGKQPEAIHTANASDNNYGKGAKLDFQVCTLLNISACVISETSNQFILTLYNPLGQNTDEYVRVPVPDVNYEVEDYAGISYEMQFVPIPKPIKALHNDSKSTAKFELVFFAEQLPPLGFKSYYIKRTQSEQSFEPKADDRNETQFINIGNEHIQLGFNPDGFLNNITVNNTMHNLTQEILYYTAALGDNTRSRSAGAHIFRPSNDVLSPLTSFVTLKVFRGKLVEEAHQVFNNWTSQVVRIYHNSRHVEFDWQIGTIPVEDYASKDVITRFKTNIKNNGLFYTDSNGRETIVRMRNKRDTWNVFLYEKVSGNFYPVASRIALEDQNMRMSIITDRPQGGGSLNDGSLELLLHRRIMSEDSFGIREYLNDQSVARGKHYLMFGSAQQEQSPTMRALERFAQQKMLLPSGKFFSDAQNYTSIEWQRKYVNVFHALLQALPKQIHLLTFEPWHKNELLIRFEHILEKDDDPEYSKVVKINLHDVLHGYKINTIRETTLAANVWLDEKNRLNFKHPKYIERDPNPLNQNRAEMLRKLKDNESLLHGDHHEPRYIIEMKPMQIRTFVIGLQL